MSNTYEYKVTDLQRDPNGIVVAASFTVTASDGEDSFTHNYYTAFKNNPVTPIPFEQLTESKVIEWIKRNVQQTTEESADAELAAYKKRKSEVVLNGTPW